MFIYTTVTFMIVRIKFNATILRITFIMEIKILKLKGDEEFPET